MIDYRNDPKREARLLELIEAKKAIIWREADAAGSVAGADRHHLERAAELVIWTTPPGLTELKAVLERVQPERVHLFAVDPEVVSPEAFARRLAGLVKHALTQRAGATSTADLAAAMGSSEVAVRLGLAWLEARGDVRVQAEKDGVIRLEAGTGHAGLQAGERWKQLEGVLEETAAYRKRFRAAAANRVLPPRTSRQ